MSDDAKKPPQDFRNIEEFYEYKAKNIDLKNERVDAKWNAAAILELVPRYLKINSILEIGCGHGMLLANICKSLNIKSKIGIDVSKAILAVAKKELPEGEFLLAHDEELPFKEGSIDLAVFCDVLEHFDNPEKALVEAKRVSKYIAVKVPLERCIKTSYLEFSGKKTFGLSHHSGHLHCWGRKEILKIFKNVDLQLAEYKVIAPPTQMRYRSERFKGSWLKPFLIFLEKSTYKCTRKLHTIIFGSDFFAFCKTQ
ncbi:MAG: class I SAM-dependent methyltransferase [Candidatus Thermoplasmatota archaeon]|nr:class I SAM-dependent methyltransferase [Candidatus Thermoplasmatota archaeon]